MLKFKKPVWESRARMSGEVFSNAGLGMLWIEPALKGGNVVINLSGDNARLLQAFGDKQMVDQVLIRLHAFYPQARGAFTGYEVKRYSVDAGTGGAYLAYGPGQISKFWRLWERPVQRITFAGEHTDALYPGTLEGALRSGQRAASQAQDLLAGKSFDPAKAGRSPPPPVPGSCREQGRVLLQPVRGSSDKAGKAEQAPAKAEPRQAMRPKTSQASSSACSVALTRQRKAQPVAKADEAAPVVALRQRPRQHLHLHQHQHRREGGASQACCGQPVLLQPVRGSSDKAGKAEQAPARLSPRRAMRPSKTSQASSSALFGGADAPEAKAQPVAKADEAAPVVALRQRPRQHLHCTSTSTGGEGGASQACCGQGRPAKHAPAHKPAPEASTSLPSKRPTPSRSRQRNLSPTRRPRRVDGSQCQPLGG